MSPKNRLPLFRWRGLTMQLFGLVVLPLVVLLLLVSVGSVRLHQQAMRDLVGERDQRAARTAASALQEQLLHRSAAVHGLALRLADGIAPSQVLSDAAFLYADFDAGLAVLSARGDVLAATSETAWWQQALQHQPLSSWRQDTFSPVFPDPQGGAPVMLVAGRTGEQAAVVLGAFHVDTLARHTLAGSFPNENTNLILMDARSQVLYLQGARALAALPEHPGVAEALRGESGSTYVRAADGEHVVSFSPVPPVDWALVIEEPWELVTNPRLQFTQNAPLLLVPLLLFSMLALWFGARQIVQPLQSLESRATALGWGDFEAIREPVGGIEEIRRLQNELVHMAGKVQRARQSLRGYIGAITRGQEEERRRLARELHDDTIQALIALNQRIQLTRLKLADDPRTLAPLGEIQHMTETIIADLRRLTQALRPLYLEDLGLVTALEMLTREVQAASTLQAAFQQSGSPRRLPADVELALYRMAQEALSNVLRHARAQRAELSLRFEARQVVLSVQDDGQGFEPPESPAEFAPGGHFGLLGMHERAELIGARLEIHTAPGRGTLLSITLPEKDLRS
ncbi:MAG: hypothetical protein Fur0018_25210 [Anaerolineales bacterium]